MPRTTDDRRFPYYPAFLDLRRKRVVVVGAGVVATDKVWGLLPCGPDPLVVVAPEASAFVQQADNDGRLTWLRRNYLDGDVAGADVCFAATNDRALNALVADEARRRGVPVLAVDDVPNCDFIAASLVRRGDLIVAISTGGRSPAFARWVRERFDRDVPVHWDALLDVVATARTHLRAERATISPEDWLAAIDGRLEELVQTGDTDLALELLLHRLRDRATDPSTPNERVGFVSLVGAGPGDPELLTLRGLRRLQEAEAVVYDRLVSTEILGYCRSDAERFDVGKEPGRHALAQEEINALLVRLGRAGQRVVRLKGGDPFVFGRGGEEILALAEAGIPFEVVPGVSSALAVPAAAGIPVTHRGFASAVTIATGHAQTGRGDDDHDWDALARTRGTLVFLMAVENLDHIVACLLANGRNPAEPAAMVQSGTTDNQRAVSAPLNDIVRAVRAAAIVAPAVLIVGNTVALAGKIGKTFAAEPAQTRQTAVAGPQPTMRS